MDRTKLWVIIGGLVFAVAITAFAWLNGFIFVAKPTIYSFPSGRFYEVTEVSCNGLGTNCVEPEAKVCSYKFENETAKVACASDGAAFGLKPLSAQEIGAFLRAYSIYNFTDECGTKIWTTLACDGKVRFGVCGVTYSWRSVRPSIQDQVFCLNSEECHALFLSHDGKYVEQELGKYIRHVPRETKVRPNMLIKKCS